MKIVNVNARQILDSRGVPTIEAEVWLESGKFGRAAVPSGASTGQHEAHELRDGGSAFNGKSVQKAVANVNGEIADRLRGMSVDDQNAIDAAMIKLDGTKNKSRLGANALLAVSLACAKAAARERGVLLYAHINDIAGNPDKSLPMPMMNVLNGGKHATNSADFQEYMIIPLKAENFHEAVQIGAEVFMSLKKVIQEAGVSTAVGDEGGFTYPCTSNTEPLDILTDAVKRAGYEPGVDVRFAMDVAASEFYVDGMYALKAENRKLSTEEMNAYLEQIVHRYPVASIEDGLSEDDWGGWSVQTNALGHVQLVGDDLLVTNIERLQKAIDMKVGNAILIKPNQIGTLTETIHAIQLAKKHGWRTIVSHRSGETEDVTITHLAIGTGADQIKTGSMSRSERTAKYNELMRLEEIDETLRLAHPFGD